ncbi:hypothetical protein AB9H29_14530 [Stenotrophomonas sepilia]|uniref:hypothetical protein n=1 Tax=Stenotrophomonas sepilia TaxID=2860290 RepID=UPI00355862C8
MSGAVREVKDLIFASIRKSNMDVGHAVNQKGVYLMCASRPSALQAMPQAFAELVDSGVLESRNGGYFLTQTGLDAIYPETLAESFQVVWADVLGFMRKQGAVEGHIFHQRSFGMTNYMKYNPKQKAVLEEVMEALVKQGVFEHRPDDGLFLTAKGQSLIHH